MTARTVLRGGLGLLTGVQALVGAWALPAPRAFYDSFPMSGHPWVALLPPFNEHLVRDVGALSLALTVVLGAATVTLERRMVRVGLAATAVYALPHAMFHLARLEGFPPVDAVAQTAGTLAHLALVGGLLALTWWLPAAPPGSR